MRVAQKYPGKTYANGPKQGQLSGNPAGKNPSDVWDIPNVKANHLDKTAHPSQFPVGLVQCLVRALSKPGDLVLNPFCSVASAGVAALVEDRRFPGAEIDSSYVEIAANRLNAAAEKTIKYRPVDRAIHVPTLTSAVVKRSAGIAVPLRRPVHHRQSCYRTGVGRAEMTKVKINPRIASPRLVDTTSQA